MQHCVTMDISGSRVLLTGATGGIGHAIARRLHRGGASLVLTGRRRETLQTLANETDALALAVDLADAEALDRLVADAGDIDIVVNNAGVPGSGLLTAYSTEQIDRALDVNLRAPVMLTRHYAEIFTARRRGHLVFVSSLSGKAAPARSPLYAATKFGLRGFGQSLRADLAAEGVGVSVIFPGFIRDAGMYADTGLDAPPGLGSSTPAEVAEAVTKAIRRNLGEVDVAPLVTRLLTRFAANAPELARRLGRLVGADRIAAEVAEGQADKR